MISTVLVYLASFFFQPSIPPDRNTLQKNLGCCPQYHSVHCVKMADKANQEGCLSELEYTIAKRDKLLVTCEGIEIAGACRCGCFDPSTRISVWDKKEHVWKNETIQILREDANRYSALTWPAGDHTSRESYEQSDFTIVHCDHKPLLVFDLFDGTVLKVTAEHPMWDAVRETFVRADQMKPGDQLLVDNGESSSSIRSISHESGNPGAVVNIRFNRKGKRLVLANGVWTGGANEQDNLAEETP